MGGLIGKLKDDIKNSGANKGKFFYVRDGEKRRVRFLQELDDGLDVSFHDNYEAGVNVPCQELFGRSCRYCEDETMRTRSQYIWSVWDYDAKEVKIFMFAMNNCSPLPPLMAFYETYGTMTDRDYVISVTGKGTGKSYSVVPMDKQKFRNSNAKPMSKSAILKALDKAYPDKNGDSEDADYGDSDDGAMDYEEMSAIELYKLCKERKITVESRKPEKYYIKKLKEWDEENAEDESDEDADDWGDEDDSDKADYSELTPKELYQMCKDRKIECAPKKPAKFYINLLEEDDAAHDDWEDEDESDDEWD